MPGKKTVDWQTLEKPSASTGYVAYYYSDQDATLPVRGIRKQWDSKADPNIETKTYGVFTTCMPSARRNMVEQADSYIFFFTHWKGQRMFTGYYELDSFVKTGITPRANGRSLSFLDYGLRAKKVHFISEGIPLVGPRWSRITADSIGENSIDAYGPRDFSRISSDVVVKLKALLDSRPNATEKYINEIKNLENDNLRNHGFRYPSWMRKNGFTENDIPGFIK